MATIPGRYFTIEELESEIARVEKLLGPDVVRVRHSIRENHHGEPSIYFRIVLSDEAATRDRLRPGAAQIDQLLWDQLQPLEKWGMGLYTNYRSDSETVRYPDRAWE